jgi:hypothetical protein
MSAAVLVSDRTDRRLGELAKVTGWTVEQVIEAAVMAWAPPLGDPGPPPGEITGYLDPSVGGDGRQPVKALEYRCEHGYGPTPCRVGCHTVTRTYPGSPR